MIHSEYPIEAGEFTHAGEASVDIKRKLKQLGVSNELLRRVSVASYELEMNIVIHSLGGVPVTGRRQRVREAELAGQGARYPGH